LVKDEILLQSRAQPEEAKGAEAHPLAKSKIRKKIKYKIFLIFFCLGDLKLRDLWS